MDDPNNPGQGGQAPTNNGGNQPGGMGDQTPAPAMPGSEPAAPVTPPTDGGTGDTSGGTGGATGGSTGL